MLKNIVGEETYLNIYQSDLNAMPVKKVTDIKKLLTNKDTVLHSEQMIENWNTCLQTVSLLLRLIILLCSQYCYSLQYTTITKIKFYNILKTKFIVICKFMYNRDYFKNFCLRNRNRYFPGRTKR